MFYRTTMCRSYSVTEINDDNDGDDDDDDDDDDDVFVNEFT